MPDTVKIILELALIALLSYTMGSFPTGFLIGKLNGIDIRKHGSHNIGATNVRRVLGRDWSVICFLFDFLKGFIPVVLFGKQMGGAIQRNGDRGCDHRTGQRTATGLVDAHHEHAFLAEGSLMVE